MKCDIESGKINEMSAV